jgi:hypothetical protein
MEGHQGIYGGTYEPASLLSNFGFLSSPCSTSSTWSTARCLGRIRSWAPSERWFYSTSPRNIPKLRALDQQHTPAMPSYSSYTLLSRATSFHRHSTQACIHRPACNHGLLLLQVVNGDAQEALDGQSVVLELSLAFSL